MKFVKSFEVALAKAANPAYDATFVMSAAAPDRVKDTIDPAAYTPNLGKKLIALYQHNHDEPIGYWENLAVNSAKQLIGDIKFASTQLAQMVKTLINDGVPLGASIGFRGKGEENKAGGIHFKTVELMECSVVSVPCHPQAMQIAKKFGYDLNKIAQPKLTAAQKVALARAKNILGDIPQPTEPNIGVLEAFDMVAADARAYLVANESTIDPRTEIEITFRNNNGDFEVCFERT